MTELTLPNDEPLIIRTLEKPFLPGRQVFALYKDHLVFAIVRGTQDFPEEILSSNGADAWQTFDRAKKVLVLAHIDVDWIKSHERSAVNGGGVKLSFVYQKMKKTVQLPGKEGALVLTLLAEKFADKLDPKIDSAIDVRSQLIRIAIASCLLLDGFLAWMLWDLWYNQAITGPSIVVDIMWHIYKSRGFSMTATISILFAAMLNWLMLIVCLSKPPTRKYALNCSNCGYQLRGLTSNKCPECGTEIKK